MASELQELVEFLNTGRPEVKLTAAKIVEGLSGSAEGIASLKPQAKALTQVLLRLAGDGSSGATSRAALVALVNLSQDPQVADTLLDVNVVGRVMDFIREKTSPHVRLLVMLLANVTVEERGSEAMLQLGQEGLQGLHMSMLLKMFMVSAVTLSPGDEDPVEHVAAVLTSVTRLQAGRRLLLEPGRGLLQALAAQLASPSTVRKQGCSSAIRNCCLAAEEDGTLSQVCADQAVLRRLLAPLAGSSGSTPGGGSSGAQHQAPGQPAGQAAAARPGSDAARKLGPPGRPVGQGKEPAEPDDVVREALAESVAVLAASDEGRAALLEVDAQAILQKGYEYEEHPGVCAAMEHAMRGFMFGGLSGVTLEEEEEQQQAPLP